MSKVQELPIYSHLRPANQQLVTVEDLHQLKTDLLMNFKRIVDASANQSVKKWLKSYEVEKLLDLSPNTLLTMRNNGTIPFTRLGSRIYYDPAEIEKLLQSQKQGGWKTK